MIERAAILVGMIVIAGGVFVAVSRVHAWIGICAIAIAIGVATIVVALLRTRVQ
jgi:hypothetical protein